MSGPSAVGGVMAGYDLGSGCVRQQEGWPWTCRERWEFLSWCDHCLTGPRLVTVRILPECAEMRG